MTPNSAAARRDCCPVPAEDRFGRFQDDSGFAVRPVDHFPGLAGSAAAVWLAEAGGQVTLLERRGRLGGRTQAMRVAEVDDLADNGQHVVASGYRSLWRYLDSVGTRRGTARPACGSRMARRSRPTQ
ncbi:hypothetical protein BOX37_23385 [Nocardia mangyaensis]|uniref:Amine oxidase domain-containing protein n=1 Tax=Nocardia mangyaensis TaxID=2213200 RepID=A0A1J0VWJ9_9NOCA|nr:hypothetical protein BOX37_23385 [Nocardia mangyaensis]